MAYFGKVNLWEMEYLYHVASVNGAVLVGTRCKNHINGVVQHYLFGDDASFEFFFASRLSDVVVGAERGVQNARYPNNPT